MLKIKTAFKKTWIFIAAAAIIAGSSSAMALTLNNNIPENASANIAPSTTAIVNENMATQAPKSEITANYTLIDRSKKKSYPELWDKLKLQRNMTPEKMEETYNTIIANMTPGEKDMSAEQAAAYAAAIVKKVYGVDLTGYTAEASFSKSPVPFSDNWGILFHIPNETNSTNKYDVSVDSVNGKMLYTSVFHIDFREENNKDLENPEWKEAAVQKISKLIPENVSITESKVVSRIVQAGVTVVCELSDGSAFATRLSGESKEAVMYIYFPNGYDGSLDYNKPVTGNGVG